MSSSSSPSPSSSQSSSTLTLQTSFLSTSPTSSIDQNDLPSTLTQFQPIKTGAPRSGLSSGRTAIVATFTVLGILLLILLMVLGSCRRYRRNQLLQARARERCVHLHLKCKRPFAASPFEYQNLVYPASSIGRQDSRAKKPPSGVKKEQRLEHMESEFVIDGLAERQSNIGDDTLYDTKHPHLAGSIPEFKINDWEPNHPLPTIAPPRAHFHDSRRLSRAPSYPSLHPVISSVEGDDDSDYQLPIHASIAYPPETTVVPNQSSDCESSPKERGSWVVGDRSSQSSPPPIPPRSPLRRALSMRTMLNIYARESLVG
ncbi:hypothetical protein BJ322DRAFT_768262 [Thelephora terrestris]|uniref:Uncharacterized protein n=1 Tax=Thelephora terrestris TaxID=56493 RepID=A0A9P6HII2_9AGAM|nr:hypothetical protein BJ322DRAFT_768262 [Thelephora terrestris]